MTLGAYVFDGCSSLTSVTLPLTLKVVGASAFEDCTALVSLVIPDNAVSLGDYAFANCSSLTALRLHAAVKTFGSDLFDGCPSSLVVTCPKGSDADAYCSANNITVKYEGLTDGGKDPDPGEWSPWF